MTASRRPARPPAAPGGGPMSVARTRAGPARAAPVARPGRRRRRRGSRRTGSTAGSGTGCLRRVGMDAGAPADRDAALLLLRHGQDRPAAVGDHLRDHVLRSYMSIERTRALLGGTREGVGNVMAAGLGVVTPFCSCSAVPAFIGFVAAGVPLGRDPELPDRQPAGQRDRHRPAARACSAGRSPLLYVGAGLTIAIVAGWVLGRLQARAVGRAVRVRDQARRPGHRLHRRPDLRPAHPDGRRGGRHASCARSGPTCWSASGSAPSSTAGRPRTSSPRYAGAGNPFGGPGRRRSSASRSTPTPPASCRWSRPCTTRACRWAPCSPS